MMGSSIIASLVTFGYAALGTVNLEHWRRELRRPKDTKLMTFSNCHDLGTSIMFGRCNNVLEGSTKIYNRVKLESWQVKARRRFAASAFLCSSISNFHHQQLPNQQQITKSTPPHPLRHPKMPATTAETLSLVTRNVSVAPLVLLSVADHYGRSAKGTRKRVVGVLLGQNDGKNVRVSNSFAGEFGVIASDTGRLGIRSRLTGLRNNSAL
jgi:hypothetical protein